MLMLLKYGLSPGGVNFDAKVRRESFEPIDLFHAHIGGMDAFARGLKIAAAIRAEGEFDRFVKERYSSFDGGVGAEIESGKANFKTLEAYMINMGEISPNKSGRQEMLENLLNRYI
jgi:xylose isomerase